MVQQFNTPQKTRQAVILFLKGSATPVVMYFENPQAVYAELKQLMKSPTPVLVEKETNNVQILYATIIVETIMCILVMRDTKKSSFYKNYIEILELNIDVENNKE